MNVLLISLNKENNPYPVAPLGLAYITAALKRSGHCVEITDLCFSDDDKRLLSAKIKELNPELIGISIRNIDNLTYPKSLFYMPYIKETVELVKETSPAIIIAGGSGFSLFPEAVLRYLGIKYGVVGEGERAMVSFAENISNKDMFLKIPNLCYIDDNKFHSNNIMRDEEFHKSSAPDRDLIDNISYFNFGGMANIQSKRGCPFNCSYCTYPYIDGRQLRLRDPSDIAEEIKTIKDKYGIDYIFFVDDIFNHPNNHAMAICEEIIRRGIGMRWACFATPKGMSDELAIMMKKAGCSGIEFGTDSGSEKMLASLGKSFSLSDVERATEICRKAGLPAAHYVIFGGPGEDEKTMRETFSFFDRIKPDAVITLTGIRIYPNTGLSKLSREEGIIAKDSDLLAPEFYISPLLGAEKMISLLKEHAMPRENWIAPGLEIRASTEMLKMLRQLGKQGPLWDMLAGRN